VNAVLSWIAGVIDRLVPVMLALAIGGFVVLAWRLTRHPRGRAFDETLRDLALAAAAAIVIVVTLLSASVFGEEPQVRFVPFTDLIEALTGRGNLRLAMAELIGNVVLFVPLGMALRWRLPAIGLLGATAIAFAGSVGIEVLQGLLAAGRWSDSTDVIMNTLGGAIGALIGGIGVTRTSDG
jgi:glycopeptide antibiotics resistance protein